MAKAVSKVKFVGTELAGQRELSAQGSWGRNELHLENECTEKETEVMEGWAGPDRPVPLRRLDFMESQ